MMFALIIPRATAQEIQVSTYLGETTLSILCISSYATIIIALIYMNLFLVLAMGFEPIVRYKL